MCARTLALEEATVLAGPELTPLADAVVVIAGEAISAVGPRISLDVPADAARVDLTGTTLAPGFIDCHVHIGLHDPRSVVAGGVTTVRDLGWPPRAIERLAERSRAAGWPGPTILAAGRILTAPGGYPTRAGWAPPGTGLEVAGAAEARSAVGRAAEAGAAVIKVALDASAGPTLDPVTLAEIVRAAHGHDLKVTAHISGIDELDKAVEAGVDELAHMLLSPEAIPDRTLARMIANHTAIVPTLAIFSGRALRLAIDNLQRFVSGGGDVLYGTDLGNRGPQPGIDAHEVAGMIEAGLAPRDVVVAATTRAARALGLERAGVIAAGMDADLVAFVGDPLRDAGALTRIARVWRRGHAV